MHVKEILNEPSPTHEHVNVTIW